MISNQHKRRILIADPSERVRKMLTEAPEAKSYQLEFASTGPECMKKVKESPPDLLVLELMLPVMHGIEILRMIRENQELYTLGVIITSAQTMIQNYHSAVENGANFFLEKPFTAKKFFQILEEYFTGRLFPKPFSGISVSNAESSSYYIPDVYLDHYIRFWGTRGSNPVAGPSYVRFGGNTCCLEVRHGKDLIVIDAGTGIRPLGGNLMDEKLEAIHLFIGHTHWDHITGFPFFAPIYSKNLTIFIYSPVGFEKSAKELFTEMLAYAYFPVRLDELQAQMVFKELRDQKPMRIGDITIDSHYTYHPGATLGFRIETSTKKFGYITDNELLLGYQGHPNEIGIDHPLLEPHLSLINFLKGCDILIHEAQYFPKEYHEKIGWGHSSISNATVLFKHTGIQEWIVTHHDPKHTDEELQNKMRLHQEILLDCDIHCHVTMAYDGLVIPL